MSVHRVRWTNAASADLSEIYLYIHDDRPQAAENVVSAIFQSVESLDKNPARGRIVPELLDHGVTAFRQLVVRPYRIIYRIERSDVFIEAILDSRRNLEALLMNRLLR